MAAQLINEKSCYSITWFINNFSYCWLKTNEAIASPPISIHIPEETKWKLLLFPRATPDQNSIALYLYRDRDCDGPKHLKVEYSLELLNGEGAVLTKGEIKHAFSKDSRWGFPSFAKRKDVLRTKRMKYLPQNILTARCSMKLDRIPTQSCVENRNIFARTILNAQTKALQWNIEKFSSLTPGQKIELAIKSASKETLMKLEFFLTRDGCSEEKMKLNIHPYDKCLNFFTIRTFILDSVENEKVDVGKFQCWGKIGTYTTFTLKLSKNALMEDANVYLPDDVLLLSLELTTCNGVTFEGIEKIDFGEICPREASSELLVNWRGFEAEEITENPCALITDLKSLLKDKSLCDVKLLSRGKVYFAHSSILAARSPEFKTMFATEAKDRCVDISDFDEDTVQRLLLYMYADTLGELSFDDYFQLYKAADKYKIVSLKTLCSMLLKNELNLENACKTLLLSDIHHDEYLKVVTQNFILKNAEEVFKSDSWQHLVDTNTKLALETTLRNWIKIGI